MYLLKKVRLPYLVCEVVHGPPYCPERHGNPPGLLFKKHLTPSRSMGSRAQGVLVVPLSSGKTSEQLAAPSPSAAANFGSRRRCRFLRPLWLAGRGAGIPPPSPKHGTREGGFEAVSGSTHPPALVAPFFSSSDTRQLLPGLAGGGWSFAAQPRTRSPSHVSPGSGSGLNSDTFGFSKGDFRGKRERTPGNTCCCLPPLKYRRGASPRLPRCGSHSSPCSLHSGGGCGFNPLQLFLRASLRRSGRWNHFAQILARSGFSVGSVSQRRTNFSPGF